MGKDATPKMFTLEEIEQYENAQDDAVTPERRARIASRLRRLIAGGPQFGDYRATQYGLETMLGLSISKCYNCGNPTLWVLENVLYPPVRTGEPPNADLPDDVRADYEEARAILALSPRGAAALLRLAIQKLCKYLGEPGEHLNTDIGNLVAKGLDPRVQMALDVVRVVGNNAVHPGTIDLRDDRETADKLLELVNLVADVMITQPRHIETMFDSLPDSQKEQVRRRDNKKAPSADS